MDNLRLMISSYEPNKNYKNAFQGIVSIIEGMEQELRTDKQFRNATEMYSALTNIVSRMRINKLTNAEGKTLDISVTELYELTHDFFLPEFYTDVLTYIDDVLDDRDVMPYQEIIAGLGVLYAKSLQSLYADD